VITLLPRLVDKSLVSTVERDTRRYRLLETIRTYAAERLAASGAEPAARQRHATHYLGVAEQAAEQVRSSAQRTCLDRLATERPNLRAALAHTINTGDIETVWRWIPALRRFWEFSGQRREAYEWIQRGLAIGDPPATPVVVAGLAAAGEIVQPSDARTAFDLATRAAQLAVGLDDLTEARARRAVGLAAIWVRREWVLPALLEALARFGDDHPWERAMTLQCLLQAHVEVTEALAYGRESVALFRQVGDRMFAANTLFIMAQRSIYAGIGDDEVHEWLTESQALSHEADSEDDQVHAMVGFAQLAWLRGDRERAAQLMEECLPTLRRRGDQRCAGRALFVLGERAREQQQLARAEQLLRASVEAVVMAGQSFVLVTALEALAAVLSAQDRPRPAAVVLGAAHTARATASAHMRPIEPPDEELHRSLVQVLGKAAFDTAHREGERLSLTQALQQTSSDRPLHL
jgi:hypothetical protein